MSFLTPLTEDCCQVKWANGGEGHLSGGGGCSDSGGLPASFWASLALTFASISLVELGDGLADLPRAGLVHISSKGNPAPQ